MHDTVLTSFQAILVGSSEKFWKNHLDKIAQAYCCRLDKMKIENKHILRIVGDNAEIAAVSLREILRDPPSHLVICIEEKFRWNFPHEYVCGFVCVCVCMCARARVCVCERELACACVWG